MELSYLLDHSVVGKDGPHRLHLLLRLETGDEGGPRRKPLNLALVLDRSDSMQGEKLKAAKDAILVLANRLSSEDLLSIVTFGTAVDVLLPPTSGGELGILGHRLAPLGTSGNTNLSGGWLRALSLLAEHGTAERLSRVLLLTDGQANEGVWTKDGLVRIAAGHRGSGLVTSTFGFGRDFNEDHLVSIARAGGGNFHFIGSPEGAASAFLDEFGELRSIFGQNGVLSIHPGEGIGPAEILSQVPAEAQNGGQVLKLGDVHDRERKIVLVGLDLPSVLPEGPHTLATVRFSYDALRGKCGVRQHVIQVDFEVDHSATRGNPSREVEAEIVWHRAMAFKERAWASWNTEGLHGARSHFLGAAEVLEGHESLDASRFKAERMRLEKLAEECVAGSRAVVGKELAAESSEWHSQRGRYHADPEAVVRTFQLTPLTHAVLDDVADFLSGKLQVLGYPGELAQRLEVALRELVENGLEHGCQGRPDGKAQVGLVLGRNHAEVVVRDDGPGFNFKATLEEEMKSGGANPSKRRGRGLLLAHRAADALCANTLGNEVRASIRRRKARFDSTSETVINEQGVGAIGVLRLSEALDSHSLREFQSRLDTMIEQGISALIIDLSHCRYMNSEGLGQMIFTGDRLQEVGSRLVVVSPTPSVRTVMNMLGIDQFFSIAGSIDDAKRLLAG